MSRRLQNIFQIALFFHFADNFKQILSVANKPSLIFLSATKQNPETIRSVCSNINGYIAGFTEQEIERLHPILEEAYVANSI